MSTLYRTIAVREAGAVITFDVGNGFSNAGAVGRITSIEKLSDGAARMTVQPSSGGPDVLIDVTGIVFGIVITPEVL